MSRDDENQLYRILHARAIARQNEMRGTNKSFIHYTSAQAAMAILESEKVWLRSSAIMNDFKEIEYGIECFQSINYSDFSTIVAAAFSDLGRQFVDELRQQIFTVFDLTRIDSYIFSIAEYDPDTDPAGKLSMWRAYGGKIGVAAILNKLPFLEESHALRAYSTPVEYLTPDEYHAQFQSVFAELGRNKSLLKRFDRQTLLTNLVNLFRFSVLSTKHPAFKEEQEWRVIYCPSYDSSSHVERAIETIGGVPQEIYKIPLKEIPGEGLIGIAIPQLIEGLIIGPMQYPLVVHKAFAQVFMTKIAPDAWRRIRMSNIPLRHS